MKIWHGRQAGPLLTVWVAAFVLCAALLWIQRMQPAFIELFRPFYFIIAGSVIVLTWQWFRERSRKGADRRKRDRRREDRRDQEESAGATQ